MDLILEGPEDDSMGVETFCPNNCNIMIEFVLFDWYSVIYTGWYKKSRTFEKPNKNWRNPRKKNLTEIEPLQLAF